MTNVFINSGSLSNKRSYPGSTRKGMLIFMRVLLQAQAKMSAQRRLQNQRGVAIMMVLVTLMLLLAVSVPFVFITQSQNTSSQAYRERARARNGARSAIDHAMAQLQRRNRFQQFRDRIVFQEDVRGAAYQNAYNWLEDPFLDSRWEYERDLPSELLEDFGTLAVEPSSRGIQAFRKSEIRIPFQADDDRRQLWSAYISDEQGKINLLNAPPTLLGNLFGSGIIDEVTGELGNRTITMTEGFEHFPEGPGHFVVDGVLCRYQVRNGNTFVGVEYPAPYHKAYIETAPNGRLPGHMFIEDRDIANGIIPENTGSPLNKLAIPVVAHLIAFQRLLGADSNGLRPLQSVDQIKQVAELSIFQNTEQGFSRSLSDSFDPLTWLSKRQYFTVHSSGPFGGGFFFPHLVRRVSHSSAGETSLALKTDEVLNLDWLFPEDPRRVGSGRFGRPLSRGLSFSLRYPSGETFYGIHSGFALSPLQFPRVQNPYEQPILKIQEVAPININTASWEVLVANLKGLRHGSGIVSTADAEEIVQAIQHLIFDQDAPQDPKYREFDLAIDPPERADISSDRLRWGGLRSNQEFETLLRRLVDAGFIQSYVRSAIMEYQRSPYNTRNLRAPFCYQSYGVFGIDGHAMTFAPSGFDTARSHLREIVSVGSDGPQTWEWRDRDVLRREQIRPQGNVLRFSAFGTQGRRVLGGFEHPFLLDPNTLVAQGQNTWELNANSFLDPNQVAAGQSFFIPINNSNTSGTGQSLAELESGSLQFWYKIPPGGIARNQDHFIFDSGEAAYTNRISLLAWNGARRQHRLASHPLGLTLRVKDRTLEPAFTTVHLQPDQNLFRPDAWYHFQLNWKSGGLGHLNMLVDGVAERGVGPAARAEMDHVFLNGNNAWEARTSRLRSALMPDAGQNIQDEITIDILDIGAFPDRGVIQIGNEAIEYSVKTAQGFAGLRRGARGTTAPGLNQPPYPAGSKLTIFGYASDIDSHPSTPYFVRGGARLADPLQGNGMYQITGVPGGADPGTYYAADRIGPDTGFPVDSNFLPLDRVAGLPQVGVLYLQGPVWQGYENNAQLGKMVPVGSNAVPGQVHINMRAEEFVLFRRSSGGVQVLARYDANFQLKQSADYYHFMGNVSLGNNGTEPVVAGAFANTGSIAVLCSFSREQQGAYHDPQNLSAGYSQVNIEGEWLRYNRLLSSAGAQLFVYSELGTLQASVGSALADLSATPARTPLGPAGFREVNPATGLLHDHLAGAEITPVFFVRGFRTGIGDRVTLLESPNQNKVEGFINRVQNNPGRGGALVSLSQNLPFDYQAGASEILKFPTGELPRSLPARLRFGGDFLAGSAGSFQGGEVDELSFNRHSRGNFLLARSLDRNDRTEVLVNSAGAGLPDTVGMIKIDDELIVYRGKEERPVYAQVERPPGSGQFVQVHVYSNWALLEPSRGVLGTLPGGHAGNSKILNMAGFPVFIFEQAGSSIGPNQNILPLLGGEGVPWPYGFMRVEEGNSRGNQAVEIFGYNSMRRTSGADRYEVICGEYNPQGASPLFRRAYGTTIQNWDRDAVVTQLPVRVPDYFPAWMRSQNVRGTESPEIAFAAGSQNFSDTDLLRLRWWLDHKDKPFIREFTDALLLIRVDPQVSWEAQPNQSNGLYAFRFDWGTSQPFDTGARSIREQEIDLRSLIPSQVQHFQWRIYLFFRDGAYENDAWKDGPRSWGLELELDKETRILSHTQER